jgi:RNA polymerase sigma-70 factor (ECF subfamily)
MSAFSSNGSRPSDHELLRRIRQQDETALSALYDRYADLVYSLALRTLQNSAMAEEVTQDTFVKIWYHAEDWNPAHGKFSSWLLTVTRYTAIDRWRMEQRQPASSSVPPETLPDGHHESSTQADGEEIRRLISQLPAEQAQLIECAFFHGMTHSEIAHGFQLPLGTVKTRLRLGLAKLRELCLKESDQEVP